MKSSYTNLSPFVILFLCLGMPIPMLLEIMAVWIRPHLWRFQQQHSQRLQMMATINGHTKLIFKKAFQPALYYYCDGNICERTMFTLSLSCVYRDIPIYLSVKLCQMRQNYQFRIIWKLFVYILQTLWQYKVGWKSPNLPFNVSLFKWAWL